MIWLFLFIALVSVFVATAPGEAVKLLLVLSWVALALAAVIGPFVYR